jgi:hypothetical protein
VCSALDVVNAIAAGEGTEMNSCLYHGVLRHRRLQPKTHEFRYSVFMAWLDLDELPLLASVGVRRNRFAAAAFHDADYPLGTPLKENVLSRLESLTGERPDGRVMLLTQLRYFGFHFNPVNFYYCYDGRGLCAGYWRRFATRRGTSVIITRSTGNMPSPRKKRFTFPLQPDGHDLPLALQRSG